MVDDPGEPTVLACVLHWGDPGLTSRCVASLVSQQPHISVLVVANDDAWTSESAAGVDVLATRRNLGYAGGMNAGLRWAMARGYDYIALITNDGWFQDTSAIDALVTTVKGDERMAACGPKLVRKRRSGEAIEWTLGSEEYPHDAPKGSVVRPTGLADSIKDVGWVGGSCMVLRVGAIREVGLLDEDLFMYSEEVDWCFRALLAGWYLCRNEEVVFFEEASASASTVTGLKDYYMTRNRLAISKRYEGRIELAIATLKASRVAIGLARRGDHRWKWVASGVVDFYRNRMGANPDLHHV